MERLFSARRFEDFGPLCFRGELDGPGLQQIHGATPGKLKGELRPVCPRKAGVYGMVDRQGELLYVGKAKNLRSRLLSYFRARNRPLKAGNIIRQTATIVWEICPGEFAALLRELELIHRWRPRGNVQGQPLRRNHGFICLGRRPAPYVFSSKKPPAKTIAIFGPVPMALRTTEAIRRLNDLFQLRDCPQKQEMIFPEQGELFPMVRPPGCLRFEFGACLAPCTGGCDRKDYQRQVRNVRAFLEGTGLQPLANLEVEMRAAASSQSFERAAILRDKWNALTWLVKRLERLREARERYSFVYPQEKWWYLIHGGRAVGITPIPQDRNSARDVRAMLRKIYFTPGHDGLVESYEHIDGLMVVSSWFRKYPHEMSRTLTPAEALEKCKALV